MSFTEDFADARIARIEFARFTATRPRAAGANARRGVHGQEIGVPWLRLTTDSGAIGMGLASIPPERAETLIGTRLGDIFAESGLLHDAFRRVEFPLWDLAGALANQPVYALAARVNDKPVPDAPFRVRCYDTSLYFDDLHLSDDRAAVALIADEARFGYERGHRAFKIKVGRGNRYMDLEAGTRRDIAVIRAVRDAVGPDCELMIDANNGYNLALAKRVLHETADCRLFWLEEAFHEDAELYGDLKAWMKGNDLRVKIADGEGDASPHLLHWAREGLIDLIQYDIFGYGFSRWLELGRELDAMRVASACHHYGAFAGNYVSGHLAGGIDGFATVEWDEATVPGLDAPDYAIEAGWLTLPSAPGFGWNLDETAFVKAVAEGGYVVGG